MTWLTPGVGADEPMGYQLTGQLTGQLMGLHIHALRGL
jgi:hypothetical protein